LYGSYAFPHELFLTIVYLKTQQIELRLVAINPKFNSGSGFNVSRPLPLIQPSLLVSPGSGVVGSEGFETSSTVVVGKLVGVVVVAVVVEVEMVVGVDVVVVVVEDVEEVFDLVVVVLEVVDDLAVVGVTG